MFENFIVAVEAVLPIFLLILLGMGARRMNLMTDSELNHANRAVFQVMFPLMMFYNIYSADFSEVIWPRYFAFCITMTLVVYFLGVGVTLLIEKENRSRGALIQAIYRGKDVYKRQEDELFKEYEKLMADYRFLTEQAIHRSVFSCVRKSRPAYLTSILGSRSEYLKEILTDDEALYEEIQDFLAEEMPCLLYTSRCV